MVAKMLTYKELEARAQKSAEKAGQVNTYYCESCGQRKTLILKNGGTTPFMIGCDCGGDMKSQFYRGPHGPVDEEWYRPKTEEEVRATVKDELVDELARKYDVAGFPTTVEEMRLNLENGMIKDWQGGVLFRRPCECPCVITPLKLS